MEQIRKADEMTSLEMPSRISIKRPFAESGDLSTIADADGILNYPQGFTSVYSNPASDGGQYLKRSDLNALGNIATNDLFRYKCGGLNTFDSDFCTKIGGYPKGAVLQFLNGNYVYDVISLVDNNTYDFTLQNDIDNVNWAYCNEDYSSTVKVMAFTSNGPFFANGQSQTYCTNGTLLGYFKAQKNAPITIETDASGAFTYLSVGRASTFIGGFTLMIKDLGTSPDAYENLQAPTITNYSTNDWIPILAYQSSKITSTATGNNTFVAINQVGAMSQLGRYYAVSYMQAYINDSATFSVSTVKLYT